ncbi:MAG: hypothetical protein ACFFCQ_01910 [Promethearchaeota archaeon]
MTLIPLGDIYLGGDTWIRELLPLPNSNTFYIADGSNGLLKLTFHEIPFSCFTSSSSSSEFVSLSYTPSIIPAFSWYFSMVSIILIISVRRYYLKWGEK